MVHARGDRNGQPLLSYHKFVKNAPTKKCKIESRRERRDEKFPRISEGNIRNPPQGTTIYCQERNWRDHLRDCD